MMCPACKNTRFAQRILRTCIRKTFDSGNQIPYLVKDDSHVLNLSSVNKLNWIESSLCVRRKK
jgi:hypothetical protein